MIRSTSMQCLMIAGLLAFATSSMWAQTGSKSAATKASSEKVTNPKYRRVPPGFVKAQLTPAQKEDVYRARQRCGLQIEELEKQIEALQAKEDEEIFAILNADQQKTLKDYFDKRKAARKYAAATTTDSKKPAAESE